MEQSSIPIEVFLLRAEKSPDATALIFPDRDLVLTYAELRDRAQRMAAVMQARGVSRGDLVLAVTDRSPDFCAAVWGAWLCGAAAAMLSVDAASDECRWALDLTQPAVVVGSGDWLRARLPGLPENQLIDTDNPLADVPAPLTPSLPAPDDPALIMFTSGTTGEPKGVVQSQRAVHASMSNCVRHFAFAEGAVMLSLLPHSHTHGLLMTLLSPVYYGGAVVVDKAFDAFGAARFWELVDRYRINHFSSVPGILELLAGMRGRIENVRGDSLRFAFCASAPLGAELRRWWRNEAGCPIADNYGLTEVASWVTYGSFDADQPESTVGRPDGMVVEIIDENGRVLPAGQSGEVIVRGTQTMSGYLNDSARTAQVLRDGAIYTGDLGLLDEQGWLRLIGRIKEIINVSGQKVGPIELERFVRDIPGVAEVAAFPYPDAHYGEVPALAVVPDGAPPTLAEVRAALSDKLAAYKLPRKLFVVDLLPKNKLGKIKRGELAEMLVSRST